MKKWNESKMKAAIARAKRSAIGRTLCRLVGDRAGGVMMEYVVLGVLVIAAVVVAVIYFGDTIRNQFGSMANAASGQSQKSVDDAKKAQASAGKADTEGVAHSKNFSDKGGRD